EATVCVTTKQLEDEPTSGVQERISQNDLAFEPFAPTESHENREQSQADDRLVQLHRMQRDAKWHAADACGVWIRERDSPRQLRRPSIVITRHEASNAADRLAERDGRAAQISGAPQWQLGIAPEED